MRKPLRWVKPIVLFVGIVVVAAVVGINVFADSAVRTAIRRAGARALKVPVNVEKARLSIFSGKLGLETLTVGNPPGYNRPTLLDLSRGDIEIDTKSLLGDEVRIKDVQLDGMHVFIEQKGLDNNLHEVIRALPRDQRASGKKLVIDRLEITNVTVNVRLLPISGGPDTVAFRLTPIRMTDLGRNERLDVATLTTKILLAVARGIAEQGGGVLPKEMTSGLSGVLDKAVDIGRIIFGSGQNGAGETGRGITDGLKSLVRPKGEE
jgi:hypothetical protein